MKVTMLGTPANLTVFVCTYEYTKPPRKVAVPGSAKKEDEKVQNQVMVASANPSGEDCFYITKRLVLGENPYEGNDFRLLHMQKMVDAMGLAMITTWDKLDGKAPLDPKIVELESDEDDGDDGGSIPPPAANLN